MPFYRRLLMFVEWCTLLFWRVRPKGKVGASRSWKTLHSGRLWKKKWKVQCRKEKQNILLKSLQQHIPFFLCSTVSSALELQSDRRPSEHIFNYLLKIWRVFVCADYKPVHSEGRHMLCTVTLLNRFGESTHDLLLPTAHRHISMQ